MAEERVATLLWVIDGAWDEERWHPPLKRAVDGMTAAQAAWRPAPGALTAWQFVNHVAFWKEASLRKLAGLGRTEAEDDNDATFGGPGDGADEAAWQAALARLEKAQADLRGRVAAMRDADLAAGEREGLLYGTASHDIYHGAEIVQLRKLQGAWPASR
jgi:hypothetical protein